MELTALKSDPAVADALIFASTLSSGASLLSGNEKHFKAVPLIEAVTF